MRAGRTTTTAIAFERRQREWVIYRAASRFGGATRKHVALCDLKTCGTLRSSVEFGVRNADHGLSTVFDMVERSSACGCLLGCSSCRRNTGSSCTYTQPLDRAGQARQRRGRWYEANPLTRAAARPMPFGLPTRQVKRRPPPA